jgi:sterol 14-demethylase
VVLGSGAEANEQFFRAPDSTLDQAAAYPFTPIFGKGVVFDASPEERQQMLKNQALRGDMMRGHAQTIEAVINRMVDQWAMRARSTFWTGSPS